jgi:arylsulfatase A
MKLHRATTCLAAAAAALLAASCTAPEMQEERPSILLILADDVGQEVLGVYGGTSYPTPHLDALAGEGLRLEHAYSFAVCHPTRLVLLTGRYPFRMPEAPWGTFPPELEGQTLAHTLKQAGYATAVAGKWQLALLRDDLEHPHRLGFEEYSLFGWHEGPRYQQPLVWQNGRRRDDVRDVYGPDVYTDFLIDFMSRHREEPFFAFYSMALCHDVTDDLDEPVPFGPHGRYDSFAERVAAMDERIGKMMAALDRLGLRERTLVLFSTDNGTPGRSILDVEGGEFVREEVVSRRGDTLVPGGKGQLTDAGTRVPFLARWPGVIEAGTVADDLVDLTDFLPTFAELADGSLPDGVGLDGQSFVPTLRGQGHGGRAWSYSHHRGRSWVRDREWKLYDDGSLFEMEVDPTEAQPILPDADSPESAAARERLQAVFEDLEADRSAPRDAP